MRLVGYLIITAALVVGTLGAATAYTVSVSSADEQLLGLVLKSDAAVVPEDDGGGGAETGAQAAGEGAGEGAGADDGEDGSGRGPEPEVVASSDTEITPEVLSSLREAGVEWIHVKGFASGAADEGNMDRLTRWLALWDRWWWVALGCVGLVAGAVLVRAGAKQTLAKARRAARFGPGEAMEQLEMELGDLRSNLGALSDEHEQSREIMSRVGSMQATQVTAVVEAREVLVSRLGLGGFAQFMDRFAGVERSLNRAWSMAADGAIDGAIEALDRAAMLLPEAREPLEGLGVDGAEVEAAQAGDAEEADPLSTFGAPLAPPPGGEAPRLDKDQ